MSLNHQKWSQHKNQTFNYIFFIFNDKNQHFFHLGLVIGPPKPSKIRFLRVFGGIELTQNEINVIFFQ